MSRVRRVARIVGWVWLAAVLALFGVLVALRLFGAQVDLIESGSMAPTVPVDSLAITLPVDAQDVVVDDVITFRNGDDSLVMHRVVEVIETGDVRRFRTKGDANATTDPLLIHEIGVERRLSFSVGGLGPIARAAQPPIGAVWLAGVPAALLAVGYGDRRRDDEAIDLTEDAPETLIDLAEADTPAKAMLAARALLANA